MQIIENKPNCKLIWWQCSEAASTLYSPLTSRGQTGEQKVPTVFADQWTHLRCKHCLDWTNRRRRCQVSLQGSRRSCPAASDLPSDRRCVSGPASVSARVGRRCCPAPHTGPGGHAHLYRHTRPESSRHDGDLSLLVMCRPLTPSKLALRETQEMCSIRPHKKNKIKQSAVQVSAVYMWLFIKYIVWILRGRLVQHCVKTC